MNDQIIDYSSLATGRGAPEWAETCARFQNNENSYASALKRLGFKSSMPDDGWVDWKTCELFLAYPLFSSPLKPGDMVALGTSGSEYTQYVRVSDRPSKNRSMLQWVPFDWVCKVTTRSLLLGTTHAPRQEATGGNGAGVVLGAVFFALICAFYYFITHINQP